MVQPVVGTGNLDRGTHASSPFFSLPTTGSSDPRHLSWWRFIWSREREIRLAIARGPRPARSQPSIEELSTFEQTRHLGADIEDHLHILSEGRCSALSRDRGGPKRTTASRERALSSVKRIVSAAWATSSSISPASNASMSPSQRI